MAKKRRQPPKKRVRKRPPRSRSDWGYYLFRDSGVSVAYVGKANEDGSVEAALFGVDTWRDGLTVCHGRRFETKEAFEEAMQDRSDLIKPSTRFRCREEIAYGLRIRLTAEADLPSQFDRWRYLVDPLDDVRLPTCLYRCPDCGRGLPESYVQHILDGVDGEVMFYMVCQRCSRPRPGRKSAEYATIEHRRVIKALEESDEFSVTWYQDNMPILMNIPISPSYDDAVRMMISEGEPMRAACMAIESHIAHASVPNRTVEDRHVSDALQTVIDGKLLIENDEDIDSVCTNFLVEAIKDGIDMFTKAMRFRCRARPHVRLALQEIMDSVNNHHKGSNPRAYIQFINRFVPV
jgi:hypothetical protein